MNETIQKSDTEIISDMYSNIVLSGGGTMVRGFADRVQREIKAMAPAAAGGAPMKVNVISGPDNNYHPWTGGSILASMGGFVAGQHEDHEGGVRR